MKFVNLEILTTFGIYLKDKVDLINVPSSKSVLGILPNHAPLVADILLGSIEIVSNNKREYFATTGGVIYVKKDKTILLLDTIEKGDEIDLARALESKARAEERLSSNDANIDIKRARASLARAINRIKIKEKYN
jgi:F-type H+-transporting ATPase subunit epsilon